MLRQAACYLAVCFRHICGHLVASHAPRCIQCIPLSLGCCPAIHKASLSRLGQIFAVAAVGIPLGKSGRAGDRGKPREALGGLAEQNCTALWFEQPVSHFSTPGPTFKQRYGFL